MRPRIPLDALNVSMRLSGTATSFPSTTGALSRSTALCPLFTDRFSIRRKSAARPWSPLDSASSIASTTVTARSAVRPLIPTASAAMSLARPPSSSFCPLPPLRSFASRSSTSFKIANSRARCSLVLSRCRLDRISRRMASSSV